jgi:CAAX prenyl protease-like protein
LLVFAVWVGPDVLWPSYRSFWLFQNSLTGTVQSSLAPALRSDSAFLVFRILGSIALVPIIEELFFRGWLMRYVIRPDFTSVPLGAYAGRAFWITALMFAVEHGPFWDVGLLAGIFYNGWMIRTRSLADCILAHAVTNACLAAYVIGIDKWEYWL